MKQILLFVSLLVSVFAQNCLVAVPTNPLTAAGLSSLYIAQAPCNQSDPNMVSFVQGSYINTATGAVFAYNPLIITQGTVAASTPITPVLPANVQVALWFGTNAGTLTLMDVGGSLTQGNCVNGLTGSIFGQFAYCNAPAFFTAAYTAISAGQLKIPPLGTANDGQPCPTTHDFFVVDMDQSDNVITTYIDIGNSLGQDTQGNRALLNGKIVNTQVNGSDLRLCNIAMDGALGCTPWMVPDMADTVAGSMLPTFGTAELQASVLQTPPAALVPLTHAMTRVNNQPSLAKTNSYRMGCGQPTAATNAQADSFAYCTNLYYVGPARIKKNAAAFSNQGSPMAGVATNLFAFLGQRYATSFGPDGLNCASLLNVPNPVVPILNMGGLFVGATITVPVMPTTVTSNGIGTTNIIIIVVCTVGGSFILIGLIVGIIIYRRRTMYS